MNFSRKTATLVALACLAFDAGATAIVPANPRPFELVNLRLTVDSCAFNPETVVVVQSGTAIQVRLRDNQCLVAGAPKDVDIQVGSFAAGTYAVEVANGDGASVRERLAFTVLPRADIAVVPPPRHPLTNYSGLWWNPAAPGSGIAIQQSPSDGVFAAVFEYAAGANAQPTWITLQSGQWASSTTWIGATFRTTSPPLTVQNLGEARIEFDVPPPDGASPALKWARVTYRLADGTIATAFVTPQAL